jgi:hypothetical protein
LFFSYVFASLSFCVIDIYNQKRKKKTRLKHILGYQAFIECLFPSFFLNTLTSFIFSNMWCKQVQNHLFPQDKDNNRLSSMAQGIITELVRFIVACEHVHNERIAKSSHISFIP